MKVHTQHASYLNKVVYHAFNLKTALITGNQAEIEKSYDKTMYFINRELEGYGAQAMEDLYVKLDPELTAAILEAEELLAEEL